MLRASLFVVGISVSLPAFSQLTARLKLGEEFIKRDLEDAALSTLLPVANGAFETPEQPAAAALLPKVRAP